MLDAGLAAGEAMWMGTNILPLSLGGKGCWSLPWEHSSQFSLPDFPVWSLIDGAFLNGEHGELTKNQKNLNLKQSIIFLSTYGYIFSLYLKRKLYPRRMHYYCYYLQLV